MNIGASISPDDMAVKMGQGNLLMNGEAMPGSNLRQVGSGDGRDIDEPVDRHLTDRQQT